MTRQNVQARLRGQRMWNWANTSGALFLQTGDMSEKAVGYTTIGGDLEGALSVIANVPKTVVEALLRAPRTCASASPASRAALATAARPRAGRRPAGRRRADALPDPRRLPAPLRQREDVARRDGARAGQRLSRRPTRRSSRRAPTGSRASSPSRSTSGCSRRWPCTSARSTSIASARCRCRSCSARSGDAMTAVRARASAGAGAWPSSWRSRAPSARRPRGQAPAAPRRRLRRRRQCRRRRRRRAAADLPIGRQAGADRRLGHRQRRPAAGRPHAPPTSS